MAQKSNRKLWADYVQKKTSHSGQAQKSVTLGALFEGIVLGIDPSLRGSGFALIEYKRGNACLLDKATLKISNRYSMIDCLGKIGSQVEAFLNGTKVNHVAIEQTIYVQNFQTAQILGAARGAAIASAAMRAIPVFEYAPLRVKQAIVGKGRASKEQVAKTVENLLSVEFHESYDESDAAAVALCHAFTWRDGDA